MKWIGQHIWDFISRFRSDVYLEEIANPGSDTDKFLVADATTGKVGFRTGANVLSDIGGSGVSLGNDGNDRVVTATGGGALNGEENLTWNNIQLGLEYTGSNGPTILLTKTGDNSTAPIINFAAQRAASGGAANNDNDFLGYIKYWGYNNAGTPEAIQFAEIHAQILERDDGVEEGNLSLLVYAQNALREGLELKANGSSLIDSTLGFGTSSTATIAGNAFIKSNIELGNASDTTIARSTAGVVTIEGNEIVTDEAKNVISTGNRPIAMHVARRTITQAEANSLHTTSIEIIPAPGADKIIILNIGGSYIFADRAATNTAVSTLGIGFDGFTETYSVLYSRRFMRGVTTDQLENARTYLGAASTVLTDAVNKKVEATFFGACTNNCFTSIDVIVSYYILDLS